MADIIESQRVSAKTRVYYVDAVRDPNGEELVQITEIPTDTSKSGGRRHRVFIYREHLRDFIHACARIEEAFERNDKWKK